MSVKLAVLPSILLVVVLGLACGDGSPAAPSPTPSPTPAAPPPAPTPAPSPVPGLSDLAGEWKLALRVTAVVGSGCVADTMRSQIGVASPYSLVISQTGAVTLKNASGDRACTFTPVFDSSGFTTFGKAGYYTCDQFDLNFHCADETWHRIFTFGEDISGRLSGTQLTGAWEAFWVDGIDDVGVDMKAEFTGTR